MTIRKRCGTVQLNIRVTERQKDAWRRAAVANGLRFSSWMRLVLDGASIIRGETELEQRKAAANIASSGAK
jgi:hypothetical protein